MPKKIKRKNSKDDQDSKAKAKPDSLVSIRRRTHLGLETLDRNGQWIGWWGEALRSQLQC